LLAVSALAKRLELVRHLLDGPSEISQASDDRCVLLGSYVRLPDSVPRARTGGSSGMLERLRALRLADEELGNFPYVEPGSR
jgi:hypothetical protein